VAKKLGVELRQSYTRVGKSPDPASALRPCQSSSSAPTGPCARFKTYLGRVIRDIARNDRRRPSARASFAHCSALAGGCAEQQRGSAPQESTACMPPSGMHRQGQGPQALRVRRQGQHCHPPQATARAASSSAHVQGAAGNPYDGHTLAEVIPGIEKLSALTIVDSTPMLAIAATTRHPTTSSITPQNRSAGVTRRSNERCVALCRRARHRHLKDEHRMGRKLSRSPKWRPLTTPSPPATTSAASSSGSGFCCAFILMAFLSKPKISPRENALFTDDSRKPSYLWPTVLDGPQPKVHAPLYRFVLSCRKFASYPSSSGTICRPLVDGIKTPHGDLPFIGQPNRSSLVRLRSRRKLEVGRPLTNGGAEQTYPVAPGHPRW